MNISLERDPRYNVEKNKLTDLQCELKSLESQRDEYLQQLNGLANTRKPRKSRLDALAEGLLGWVSDESVPAASALQQSYSQLTDQISVHERAITLQRQRLADLTAEISKEISLEALPQHQTNVVCIVGALIKLEAALADEAKLRDNLHANGIEYNSYIRPMPFRGVGLVTDSQSYIARYLLECFEHGFVGLKDLPDCLIQHVPSKGEPIKKESKLSIKPGDWASLS